MSEPVTELPFLPGPGYILVRVEETPPDLKTGSSDARATFGVVEAVGPFWFVNRYQPDIPNNQEPIPYEPGQQVLVKQAPYSDATFRWKGHDMIVCEAHSVFGRFTSPLK